MMRRGKRPSEATELFAELQGGRKQADGEHPDENVSDDREHGSPELKSSADRGRLAISL
jgi:hypothetical protein